MTTIYAGKSPAPRPLVGRPKAQAGAGVFLDIALDIALVIALIVLVAGVYAL